MFGRMIDDFKESTGTALRLTSLAAAAAFALLVTTSFLCAALFVYVLQKYGPIEACLAGAGVFFVVTLIAAVCYMVRKKQIARARRASRQGGRTIGEVGGLEHAGRSDAAGRRPSGGSRHRRQEADPASRDRRTGAGLHDEPRRERASDEAEADAPAE